MPSFGRDLLDCVDIVARIGSARGNLCKAKVPSTLCKLLFLFLYLPDAAQLPQQEVRKRNAAMTADTAQSRTRQADLALT